LKAFQNSLKRRKLVNTTTQQNSAHRHQKAKSRLDEKEESFFGRIFPLMRHHAELYEQPDDSDYWKTYYKGFRIFVKKLGFRLSDFDKVIPGDLKTFLTCYYLMAEKKAPGYVIDYTYGQLLENAFDLFMSELDTLIQNVSEMTEEGKKVFFIILKLGGSCLDSLGIAYSVPPISVAKGGFLMFLACRGRSRFQKAEAILAAPYQPYVDCEPEEWLAYLFQSQNPEALPIIRRILNVMMDIIIGADEPLEKPPVKAAA
jgi:hypothetical protein